MKLLAVPSVSLRLEPRASPTADAVDVQHAEPRDGAPAAAAVSESLSLESSMTDDDGGRADVVRPRRPRRHRGADDVFPTRAIHRQQVCRTMPYCSSTVKRSSADMRLHCVSKTDTNVAHYNFNAYRPILVIFGKMSLREYAIK